MTVKNLNLAIPMDLYIALKRDAELVAAPVTTHIRGVLMRYIRSTDEAIQARRVEVAEATRPIGPKQQALDEYATMAATPLTFESNEEATAWGRRRKALLKTASAASAEMPLPQWFNAQAHRDPAAYDPNQTDDWVLRVKTARPITASAQEGEETPEELEASFMAVLKG